MVCAFNLQTSFSEKPAQPLHAHKHDVIVYTVHQKLSPRNVFTFVGLFVKKVTLKVMDRFSLIRLD